jgi:hypothetical protein
MVTDFIYLSEALKIFALKDNANKPYPFDIKYRTFNSQTKMGGKLKVVEGAKHLPQANTTSLPSLNPNVVFAVEKSSRKPEHFDNRTRNIELPNGDIKKIRIDFIIEVNGKKVIY